MSTRRLPPPPPPPAVMRCFHCGREDGARIIGVICPRCFADDAFDRTDFGTFRYVFPGEAIDAHDDRRDAFDMKLWARVGDHERGALVLTPGLVRRPIRRWNSERRFVDKGEVIECGDVSGRKTVGLVCDKSLGRATDPTSWCRLIRPYKPTLLCHCRTRVGLLATRGDKGDTTEACTMCGRLWTVRNGIAVPEPAPPPPPPTLSPLRPRFR